MQVLIVEDNPDARWGLEVLLEQWHYEPVSVADGAAAWDILRTAESPKLVLLDMKLPKLDGLTICRKVKEQFTFNPPYIICVTGTGGKEQVALALKTGADDYITKPYDTVELEARLCVGQRIVALQEKAAQLHHLQKLLPVCAWCKKVRDDQYYWQEVDEYMSKYLDVKITHGICPACFVKEAKALPQNQPDPP